MIRSKHYILVILILFAGTRVNLIGDVKKIMNELATEEQWKDTKVNKYT